MLRARPILGRTYTHAEDAPAAGAAVVVLGYGLWQRVFGGRVDVIGRTIRINGSTVEVVGVMPVGFAYPTDDTELWLPLGLDPAVRDNRASHFLGATARLADGVTLDHAHAEVATLMEQWRIAFPDMHTGHFVFLRPLVDDIVGGARAVLLTLMAAVAFVLLIVCANVANLLLARGEVRRGELAVRSALGAGRSRLVRQFVAEGLVLSLTGAVCGLALAYGLVRVTVALGAQSIPRTGSISVDGGVMLFTIAAALASALLFAAVPALRIAGAPRFALGDHRRVTSPHAQRVRRVLVATQVALAIVVAVGAGLTVRSFNELVSIEPGFDTDGVLVADLTLPAGDYTDATAVMAFYTALLERLRNVPGVTDVTATTTLPLTGSAPNFDFEIEGAALPHPGQPAYSADFIVSAASLLSTLGIKLSEGRFIEPTDHVESLPVAVVNRRLAQTFWPDGSALGRRIRMAGNDSLRWLSVVGVVDDVQYRTLADELRPAWYVPLAQMPLALPQPARSFSIAIRAERDPERLLPQTVRAAVRELDATLPIMRMRTLQRVADDSVARPRFTMTVFTVFALLAVLLGAIGIYGVLAYTVAQRTREFGVRLALGASATSLSRLVLAETARIAGAGIALGVLGALLATRLMRDLLFSVTAHDPMTYAAVAAIVCAVLLVASLVPVSRALRADPMRALRAD